MACTDRKPLLAEAAHSSQYQARQAEPLDYRSPYKRDADRILHSKAYARYLDKTQVVYLVHHDHLTRRGLHVQLVSSFARGLAEILPLNTDLVEAISLGHDVGHPPFGHEGEGYLSELTEEHGLGAFAHSAQSCRLFSVIEPLNLGLAVYDGFLTHDGGLRTTWMKPVVGKDWNQHELEMKEKSRLSDTNSAPMTLEGCLVKLCDTVSYVARDIEDAIKIGLTKREHIPQTVLGVTNEEILRQFAMDLIQRSRGGGGIGISDEVSEALRTLRRFNYETFYFHPRLKVESHKVKLSYRILFEYLLKDHQFAGKQSYLWREFAYNKPQDYIEGTSSAQLVTDFIAGMTDGFFVRTLQRLIVPEKIDLSC